MMKKRGGDKIPAATARVEHDQLMTVFNTVSDAMFSITSNGILRMYNAALLGLIDTNQSLSGRFVDDVVALYQQDGEPVSFLSVLQVTPHTERDDLVYRFADGDQIRLHISANRIRGSYAPGKGAADEGYICTLRDITKSKSLEEERDEFISVVSHELRTPIAITEGTISNLQYFLKKGAAPTVLETALEEAHDQIVLLGSMINDLSTLSRAERGVGGDLEAINLRSLAEEQYKNYTSEAKKKGLTLNLDLGARLGTLTTSRLYLEEMLQNFITNAIKYTHTGSVTLSIIRETDHVVFTVTDTGIGISKTDIKHIFEKFYRSEDYRTRETSGTGLGLYVVEKLMHKLGTRVRVTSRLNHGSSFSFSLPVND